VASIEQSIEVDVPRADAERAWERFTQWVLVGQYRLVCDAWTCERMADRRVVSVTAVDRSTSRVTAVLDVDVAVPDPGDRVRRCNARLAQDLMKFREYVRSEKGARRGSSDGRSDEKKRGAPRDGRPGRLSLTPESLIERDDSSYGSPHFQA
jgi:hypothetical protein